MVVFIAFSGYSQNTDIKGLLDKPETRTEIFNTIVGDHGLMMEFMKTMKGSEHATMMMKDNNQMMGMMKDNPGMMQKMMSNMMDMCEQDSTMRCNMANMISKHPKMMSMITQQIEPKKMMGNSGGCMQMMNKKEGNEQEHNHQH